MEKLVETNVCVKLNVLELEVIVSVGKNVLEVSEMELLLAVTELDVLEVVVLGGVISVEDVKAVLVVEELVIEVYE
jgi:hypothetical protein